MWSLGVVLYEMMTGSTPKTRNISGMIKHDAESSYSHIKPLPRRYSTGLKEVVYDMLAYDAPDRPDAEQLCYRVANGMKHWRLTSPEGRDYVERGD